MDSETLMSAKRARMVEAVVRRWSNLSPEILSAIGKCLETRVDVIRFRSVCKQWRKSLPLHTNPNPSILSPFLPLQIPNSASLPFNNRLNDSLVLVASAVFLVQPLDSQYEAEEKTGNSEGWLLTVEERKPGQLRALWPLSKDHGPESETILSWTPANPRILPTICPPKVSWEEVPSKTKKKSWGRGKTTSEFPKSLNLFEFRVTEIAKLYKFKYVSDDSDVFEFEVWDFDSAGPCFQKKVVLCPNSDPLDPVSDQTAMVLCEEGSLVGVRLKSGKWDYVQGGSAFTFVDVSNYRGLICSVDQKGNVYAIDHKSMRVIKTIAINEIPGSVWLWREGNHVVESNRELFLVFWYTPFQGLGEAIVFKIYKLNEVLGKWDDVGSIGDQVLFVSLDWCFPVWHGNLVGSEWKCIICSEKCFYSPPEAPYGNWAMIGPPPRNLSIWLYSSHDHGKKYKSMPHHSFYVDIARMLVWPPWFLADVRSSSRYPDKPEDGHSNLRSEQEKVSAPALVISAQEQIRETIGTAPVSRPTFKEQAMLNPSLSTSGVQHIQKQALDADNNAETIRGCNAASAKTNTSVVKFEGVDVRSDLVPILQKIWDKYGNIIDESVVHAKEFIACALESLAKVIIILQSSSGRTLTESQCNDLRAITFDLKLLEFRVDWLMPFVERAVALHASKPIYDALTEIEEVKARTKELKMKFVAELASLDEAERQLEVDRTLLSEKIPLAGPVNLDQCVGEGLL